MKKYSIFILIILFCLISGCNGENVPSGEGEITIRASVGSMTKMSYEGDVTHFTSGDKIAIYGWTGDADAIPATRVVDGVVNTFDGSDWTPATKMLWKNLSEPHWFLGISPVFTIDDLAAGSYTLDPADYTASDLLVATNLGGVKATDGPVTLKFDHVMAKLVVDLNIRSGLDATGAKISVSTQARTEASVDYLTKTVLVKGDVSEVDLPASSSANTTFESIMVPQTGVRKITVVFNDIIYRFEASDDIPLKTGKCTVLDLSVGKEILELNFVSVIDWESGGEISGGGMTHTPSHINGHEFVEMGDGLKWATCNLGASYPYEYGSPFAWGEIDSRNDFKWETYKWGDGETLTKYYGTDFISLLPEDDAARKVWGADWRTPTDAEWAWLCDDKNCSWTWMTDYLGSGENGMLVTSRIPGFTNHTIFLPASGSVVSDTNDSEGVLGCYWSSSLHETSMSMGKAVFFSSDGVSRKEAERYIGLTVRPVASGNLADTMP